MFAFLRMYVCTDGRTDGHEDWVASDKVEMGVVEVGWNTVVKYHHRMTGVRRKQAVK